MNGRGEKYEENLSWTRYTMLVLIYYSIQGSCRLPEDPSGIS